MGEMVRCAGETNYLRYYKRLGPTAKLATSYMKDRAMRLKEVTLARGTMALSPRATVGMTMSAQIA
jgi:hypothetical protein